MSNMIEEMTQEYSPVNQNARLGGIMEKWSRTGLMKNLDDGKAQVVAQLLENQAVELRSQMLNEESQTGQIAGYNKIAFPLVRRVFGQLLASELVAVQPMSLPSGLLFFLDFHFDRSKSGATAGGSVYVSWITLAPIVTRVLTVLVSRLPLVVSTTLTLLGIPVEISS